MNEAQRHSYRGDEAALAWRAEARATEVEGSAVSLEAGKKGIGLLFTREAAAAWESCGAFERVALGHLTTSSALIAVFAGNLAHPVRLFGIQALVAALILTLCLLQAKVGRQANRQGETAASRFWRFWRHWYPHLFFLFCFEELGKLVHLVTPTWQDAKLIAFDQWLTGVSPSLWLKSFYLTGVQDFYEILHLKMFSFSFIHS